MSVIADRRMIGDRLGSDRKQFIFCSSLVVVMMRGLIIAVRIVAIAAATTTTMLDY
jgi:hypothetical protein